MVNEPAPNGGVAAVYRDDPRLAPLIGPGGPFEVHDVVVRGVRVRDFVRAPRTINDIFAMGAAHIDRTHLVYEDERLTFAETRAQSLALARELQSSFGVGPGDRVAIAMRNLPEFVVSFWGAALAGAIVVPLNSWWQGPELTYALRDAGVVVAFVDDERYERVLVDGRPDGLQLVMVRTSGGDVPYDEIVGGAPLDASAVAQLEPDSPVTLLYTSGTTGRPKGALGTNRNAIANLWNMAFANAREALLAEREPPPPVQPASLAAGPLFHIGGVASIIGGPMGGSKLVLMRKWDVDEGVRLAVREEVTNLGGVPTIARQILEYPGVEELDLRVRGVPMGGAAVPPDLPKRALQVYGDVQILNGYGSTETTSAVVINVGVEFAARPDSVGRPNLTADIRVVDPDDGRTLGAGEIGELCFRSPQVVDGYWNDEDATRASFVDGWFHTGDLGYVDDDGFVYVVDRLKDVIIRGGENVYCAEVEAVLQEHPDVASVAVVGVKEPVMGERVCAVVVPRAGADVRLGGLREFAASQLAGFKCPEALHLIEELPKTATEKVAKPELRARLADPAAEIERRW
jgi:acyl-CoA synthetase (AMP-forming)/AMP-acid ligase II